MAKSIVDVGYYSAIKRTQMLIYTTYWMNLKDMLGKQKLVKRRNIFCDPIYMIFLKRQSFI